MGKKPWSLWLGLSSTAAWILGPCSRPLQWLFREEHARGALPGSILVGITESVFLKNHLHKGRSYRPIVPAPLPNYQWVHICFCLSKHGKSVVEKIFPHWRLFTVTTYGGGGGGEAGMGGLGVHSKTIARFGSVGRERSQIRCYLWITDETSYMWETRTGKREELLYRKDCSGISPIITVLVTELCFPPPKLSLPPHDRPACLKELIPHFSREMWNLTVW